MIDRYICQASQSLHASDNDAVVQLSKKLLTLQMENNSVEFPNLDFETMVAESEGAIAKDVALAIIGFKANEVASGLFYNSGLATLNVQLQGARLVAMGNPFMLMNKEDLHDIIRELYMCAMELYAVDHTYKPPHTPLMPHVYTHELYELGLNQIID
jgi:hypothetical protein